MSNAIVNYEERLAAMAVATAEAVPPAPSSLRTMRTSGGILAFGGDPMSGNHICAIVLDSVLEHTYYEAKWDSDALDVPKCYAFGRSYPDMQPSELMNDYPDVFTAQNENCKACPKNQWGSSSKGKGKACQERRRLYIIPGGEYTQASNGGWDLEFFDDTATLSDFAPMLLKTPVRSSKHWDMYTRKIAKEFSRPPLGVYTRIWCEPSPKGGHEIKFEALKLVDQEMLPTLFELHEQAKQDIITPYYVSQD